MQSRPRPRRVLLPRRSVAAFASLVSLAVLAWYLLAAPAGARAESRVKGPDGGTGAIAGRAEWIGGGPAVGAAVVVVERVVAAGRDFPAPWSPDLGAASGRVVAGLDVPEDGRFRVEGLRAGRYEVSARAGRPRFAPMVVEIGRSAATEVSLAVDPGGTVVGRLVFDDGQGAAGGEVWLAGAVAPGGGNALLAGGERVHVQVDAAGAFRLPCEASGRVVVAGWHAEAGFSGKAFVDLAPRATAGPLTLVLPRPGGVVPGAAPGGQPGESGGITFGPGRAGLRLEAGADAPSVRRVARGLPAEEAGLGPGDRLLEVDGVPTLWMDASELSARLTGPVGTPVDVRVQPGGGTVRVVRLVRRGRN